MGFLNDSFPSLPFLDLFDTLKTCKAEMVSV
jgi:hypothetical protein